MSLFDGPMTLSELINTIGTGGIVNLISTELLGAVFGTIAVLGVILLPITSGDTAFRSARMIIADYIKVPQKKIMNRMLIATPLFVTSIILTTVDFSMLWQYFNLANVQHTEQKLGALQAQKSLRIAKQTLAFLKDGLNHHTAVIYGLIKQPLTEKN